MPTSPIAPPYGHPAEAYQHFKKDESARGYNPWDERRDGDWVLVYFWQTQSVQLYPTLEGPADWWNWNIYRHNVFLSADELNQRHTSLQLEGMLLRFGWDDPMPTGPQLAEACWKLAQLKGHKNPRVRQASNATKARQLYTIDLARLKSPEGQEALGNLPKQAKIIGQAFADANQNSFTQEDLDSFARQLIIGNKLKTKQDPCRVVAYYLPTLSDLGLLTYPGRRKGEEVEEVQETTKIDVDAISEA